MEGREELIVELSLVELALAVAIVYSMIKNPEYTIETCIVFSGLTYWNAKRLKREEPIHRVS